MTSKMMAAVRNKDSKAELLLRRALHARGLRYRLHARDLPGRPDIVFRARRMVVFLDGDLWHGNAWRVRGRAAMSDLFPTRTDWWVAKITRNMERDREVDQALQASGWSVIRVWESDVLRDTAAAVELVVAKLVAGTARPDAPHHHDA